MYATGMTLTLSSANITSLAKASRMSTSPKNHEERWIPLTTELLELLMERQTEIETPLDIRHEERPRGPLPAEV